MQSLIGFDPSRLVATYGYPAIALESTRVPLPGETVQIAGPVGIGLAVAAVGVIVAVAVFLRRHEAQFAAEAEHAFPGSLAPPARQGAR